MSKPRILLFDSGMGGLTVASAVAKQMPDAHLVYSADNAGFPYIYFDPELNQNYVPFVVETSIGLDRMFLSVLSQAYKEEKLEDGTSRVVLNIPAFLAPVKVAVLAPVLQV